jgi:hypothetical protein
VSRDVRFVKIFLRIPQLCQFYQPIILGSLGLGEKPFNADNVSIFLSVGWSPSTDQEENFQIISKLT